MKSFYWASNIKDLCRRTAIGDLGAAHTLAGRLSDKGFNTELIVTTISQMIARSESSVHEPHWQVEFDEDYAFVGSYA